MTSLGRNLLLALGALLLGAAPAVAQQQAPRPAEAAPQPPPPQQGETARQQTAPEPAVSEEPEGTAEQAAAQPQEPEEPPAEAAAESEGEIAAAEPADAAAAGQAEAPAAAPAPDVVPGEEIATRIAETYGVEVLGVKRDDLVGGPAYAVKVMHPGGNSNAAFQVSTLLVDAVSGELIPQFRHRPIGYQLSGAMRAEPATPQDGTALRRRTYLPAPRQGGGDAGPGG